MVPLPTILTIVQVNVLPTASNKDSCMPASADPLVNVATMWVLLLHNFNRKPHTFIIHQHYVIPWLSGFLEYYLTLFLYLCMAKWVFIAHMLLKLVLVCWFYRDYLQSAYWLWVKICFSCPLVVKVRDATTSVEVIVTSIAVDLHLDLSRYLKLE